VAAEPGEKGRFLQGGAAGADVKARVAAHHMSPMRPQALQIGGASRTVPTSLGVLAARWIENALLGEKNPWNLTRVMPPQGSVEVSIR